MQPVAELSELSRRGGSDGRQVELAAANIRGGTLRRSGSLRFHQNMVSTLFSVSAVSRGISRKISLPFVSERKGSTFHSFHLNS